MWYILVNPPNNSHSIFYSPWLTNNRNRAMIKVGGRRMSKTSKVEINVGDKIGAVEVMRRVFNARRKEWEYVCRCRCGNEFRTRKDHLLKPRVGCRACANRYIARTRRDRRNSDSAGSIINNI